MRPTTASSSSTHVRGVTSTSNGSGPPRVRPLSASIGALSSPSQPPPKDKPQTSSDELIRDLETKVRKVVEQKRAESDKLRFTVAKKRDEVEKAKRILQDLLKDSDALGLHYDLSDDGADGLRHQSGDTTTNQNDQETGQDNEKERLQPIVSISRRPVYSKHTNIGELEAKLERRATEAHLVQRRTLVVEHIKKRLQNERIEVAQTTNQLKQVFADLTHETHELQKRDLAAAEAVSHIQTRLVQQKADMATSVRAFRRELAVRHKWAKEKAKFEKYYNDQLQAATAKAASLRTHSGEVTNHHVQIHAGAVSPSVSTRRTTGSPTGILKHRRMPTEQLFEEMEREDRVEQQYRKAFQRIGVDARVEAIDPEEIIHICLAHEALRAELDTKHDDAVERIAVLRDQIDKARGLAREDVPLSKRGTSQKLETKQLEISGLERQLATVVDQYTFVENTVRPIKIGLQQVLQNVSSATVNVDNMAALEKCLVDSCEDMMRLLRVASPPPQVHTNASSIPEGDAFENQDEDEGTNATATASPVKVVKHDGEKPLSSAPAALSLESFASPYNVRIVAKEPEPYVVRGLSKLPTAVKAEDEDDTDETDFDVMDRAMVKRVSSVVVCTSICKKPKDKSASSHHHHHHHHSH